MMTTNTSPAFLVDRLGYLKAQIAELKKQEEELKTALIAGGNAEYDGQVFHCTVKETSRSYLDADLAKAYLTDAQRAKITKVCGTVTVRVTARKS